jgi:uncharacterized membrane protein YtjA (UPF0391 family)
MKGEEMNFVKNMGTADRTIRVLMAVIVAILYFTGNISGTAAVVLGILAVIFLVTSLVGFCPAYRLLGASTRKREHTDEQPRKS